MERKYLIVNTGSTSKKFSIYVGSRELIHIHMENDSDGMVATIRKTDGYSEQIAITVEEYNKSLDFIFEVFQRNGIVETKKDIYAIGVRIVAPGIFFQGNKLIDDDYIRALEVAREEVPLHVNSTLDNIKYLLRFFPDVPIVGISDSAFHRNMPDRARVYSLPKDMAENLGLYRFGYHGISVKSLVQKIEKMEKKVPQRLIICHLGGGSSITALKDGVTIDTSMGFTPLEGAIMATRVGDVDPGAIVYLSKKMGMEPETMESYLNHECGLLGISGTSSDIRDLIKYEKEGDKNASLALEIFAYRVKKYIGSYVAALNGLDCLIFSGTVGVRSFIMRKKICDDLDGLGIILDITENNKNSEGNHLISAEKSPLKIFMLETDEMLQMAEELENYL